MPCVARLGEVLYLRLRNADEKWEAKDLNDMNFLCAAADYADATVGKKKTIEYLRRRLNDAVELLSARRITS